jgi:putative tryptophan/tyrosine transport system substrate-binding protein
MIDRRTFVCALAGGLLAAPLTAEAQGGARVPRIGVLYTGSPPPESSRAVEALRRGLRDLGYVEGRNIALEYRWVPEGRPDHLSELAVELVRIPVDVIIAQTTSHTLAARRATSTIPIVMGAVSDPVGSGLVLALARPGGNVTGLSLLAPDVARKLLELLRDAVPNSSSVAALSDPDAPGAVLSRSMVETAAKVLGVRLHVFDVRDSVDLDRAFRGATGARVRAVVTMPSPFFATHRARVAELALQSRLPAASIETGFAQAGGLLSYGPNIPDSHRRAAMYVDKILKGARPTDLPVEQPTKFELVINLKTAKALGLTIPPSLLQRADQVIE